MVSKTASVGDRYTQNTGTGHQTQSQSDGRP